jgi:aspartate dehydrogenase
MGRALVAHFGADLNHITVLLRAGTPPPDTPHPALTFVSSCDALLGAKPDLVAEVAGHAAVAAHAEVILSHGTDLIVASLGAFADPAVHIRALAAARGSGAALILPSGAIGGLDLLRVLAASGDVDVTYEGIKPPAAWKGTDADTRVNLDALTAPRVFFTGTGRAAALQFPKNANVVAALALAGAGFDTMQVDLIADPAARTNTHSYRVRSAVCDFRMKIDNAASAGNARTSHTTVLSIAQEIVAHAAHLKPPHPQARKASHD